MQALNAFYSGQYFNLDEATEAEQSYPDPSRIDEVICFLDILRLGFKG